MRHLRRGATALALLVVGALIGLAALAVHALWWGLLLTSVASLAMLWALPPRLSTLPPYAVGWWVPLLIGWAGRREGDYALERSTGGYLLVAVAVVVVVGASFLTALKAPLRSRARDSAPRDAR